MSVIEKYFGQWMGHRIVGIGRVEEKFGGRQAIDTMKDITNLRWIKFKGILFLVVGLLSFGRIVVEHPEIKLVLFLTLTVWCFCRFYYFAFYVIEHYVDPSYRFSGLWSFARYLFSRKP